MQWFLKPELRAEFQDKSTLLLGPRDLREIDGYIFYNKAEYYFGSGGEYDCVYIKVQTTEGPSFARRDTTPLYCVVDFRDFRAFCLQYFNCEPVGGPTDNKVNWKEEGF
jgi:hypothetical protein